MQQYWPLGDSEMARLIREFDWSSTPLGATESWPQSLKSVVDVMLGSAGIMSLVWGGEAIHIYNDAFADKDLGESGAEIIGPFSTVEKAVEVLQEDSDIHGAILDINVQGTHSYTIADMLIAKKIPFSVCNRIRRQCYTPGLPAHSNCSEAGDRGPDLCRTFIAKRPCRCSIGGMPRAEKSLTHKGLKWTRVSNGSRLS